MNKFFNSRLFALLSICVIGFFIYRANDIDKKFKLPSNIVGSKEQQDNVNLNKEEVAKNNNDADNISNTKQTDLISTTKLHYGENAIDPIKNPDFYKEFIAQDTDKIKEEIKKQLSSQIKDPKELEEAMKIFGDGKFIDDIIDKGINQLQIPSSDTMFENSDFTGGIINYQDIVKCGDTILVEYQTKHTGNQINPDNKESGIIKKEILVGDSSNKDPIDNVIKELAKISIGMKKGDEKYFGHVKDSSLLKLKINDIKTNYQFSSINPTRIYVKKRGSGLTRECFKPIRLNYNISDLKGNILVSSKSEGYKPIEFNLGDPKVLDEFNFIATIIKNNEILEIILAPPLKKEILESKEMPNQIKELLKQNNILIIEISNDIEMEQDTK